jgi:integrase
MSAFLQKNADGTTATTYSIKFYYNGKQIKRQTGCTRRADAEKIERDLRAELTAGRAEVLQTYRLRAVTSPLLTTIIAAYNAAPVEASATTRKHNGRCLKQIITAAGIDYDTATLRDLSPALLRQWFSNTATELETIDDQSDANSLRKTRNSIAAQARGIAVPRAVQYYLDTGAITDTAAEPLRQFYGAYTLYSLPEPRMDYCPPSDDVVARTLAAILTAPRDQFIACCLALCAGLRRGEICQARWDWFTQRNGAPAIDARASVKNGTGLIQTKCLDPWYTALMARAETENWLLTGQCITGSATYTTDTLYRDIAALMRGCGWNTTKAIHSLRAYAGSCVAMRYDIYTAQQFLRHSSVQVTEQHYSHFIKQFRSASPETLPWHWASAPQQTAQPIAQNQ